MGHIFRRWKNWHTITMPLHPILNVLECMHLAGSLSAVALSPTCTRSSTVEHRLRTADAALSARRVIAAAGSEVIPYDVLDRCDGRCEAWQKKKCGCGS